MLLEQGDSVLAYDGSFDGFLCCVFYVFKSKSLPLQIQSEEKTGSSLFLETYIPTKNELAKKMQARLRSRLTLEQYRFIQDGFLTDFPDKERCLLEAIDIALTYREPFSHFLGKPAIRQLQQAIQTLKNEVHHYKGFVRFERVNADTLYSIIEPKGQVLPALLTHFKKRYPLQVIVIFDKTHHLLAWAQKNETKIIPLNEQPNWQPSAEEQAIQQQWITFFQTIGIQERENPTVQNSLLPKRFRAQMLEFSKNGENMALPTKQSPSILSLEKPSDHEVES